MRLRKICNTFSIITGILFLTQSVWLLSNPAATGGSIKFLPVLLNAVGGIAGLYYGNRHKSRSYLIISGLVLTLVSALWFIGPVNQMLADSLNINIMLVILYVLFGSTGLLIGIITPKRKPGYYNAVLLY